MAYVNFIIEWHTACSWIEWKREYHKCVVDIAVLGDMNNSTFIKLYSTQIS